MKNTDNFSRRRAGIAQGYVRIRCRDEAGKVVYDSKRQKNTVVNDARRSAAAAFANQPGIVGLGFNVKRYRCGFSDVITDHWDSVNNVPLDPPVTETTLLPMYDGTQIKNFWHTQADVSGLLADGYEWAGTGVAPVHKAIPLSPTYPFSGDEYCVQLSLTLDALTSVGAQFDTVEVLMANGKKFAHRWTYPITKQAGWSLAIEHLILF